MPSLAAPLTLAPKLLITRPRSGQRNAGWPLAAMPAGPAVPASSAGGSTVVATRAFADGSADAVFVGTAGGGGAPARGLCCGFAAAGPPAWASAGALAEPAVFADAVAGCPLDAATATGIVSFVPILSRASGWMPLATTMSFTLTRYWREILLSVSPVATVWTGATGSKVCPEPDAAASGAGGAARFAGAGAAATAGVADSAGADWRGVAAWATFVAVP